MYDVTMDDDTVLVLVGIGGSWRAPGSIRAVRSRYC